MSSKKVVKMASSSSSTKKIQKKKVFVTPISRLKQTTLTQLTGDESTEDDNSVAPPLKKKTKLLIRTSSDDDGDNFVTPPSKRKTLFFNPPSSSDDDSEDNDVIERKTKYFSSKDKAYKGDKTKPQPGDLVISTAGEIAHPAISYGHVGKAYIIFGVVKYFISSDLKHTGNVSSNELLHINWMTLEEGNRYIDMASPEAEQNSSGKYGDLYVDINPVRKHKVRLLSKSNTCELRGLNGFLKKAVMKHFKHQKPEGWTVRTNPI